ncbi:hypothetical protein ACLMJK_006076 [Lecanora helva]
MLLSLPTSKTQILQSCLLLTLTSLTPLISSFPTENTAISRREPLPHSVPASTSDQNSLPKRQAGLAWGPIYIGNLKLSLTNPHMGYAGPKFPNANHVNFHVDKEDPGPRKTYSEVVNMHIVKYTRGGGEGGSSSCLYAWDSVTKTTVFDECTDDFAEAIEKCVEAVKGFVDTLLRNADFVASVAIIAALVVALAAALASLGAVAVA